jgi:hypothetical protein
MYSLRVVGYQLLVPFGENIRYDLVIDDGVRLARVQCKTGRLRNGVIIFHTASTYGHHPNPKILKRNYLGEIDFFAVYCPETKGVYLIPIADMPNRSMAYLRIDPPLNGQRKNVRFAANYELDCRRAMPEPGVRAGGSGSCA